MVPSKDLERRVRSPENVPIRRAVAGDGASLVRLAQLDSKRLPSGSLLMAEVDGEPWAAIELESREVLADPFHPTADLCGDAATASGPDPRRRAAGSGAQAGLPQDHRWGRSGLVAGRAGGCPLSFAPEPERLNSWTRPCDFRGPSKPPKPPGCGSRRCRRRTSRQSRSAASRADGSRLRTPRPRLARPKCTENVPPCRSLLAVKQAPEPRLVGRSDATTRRRPEMRAHTKKKHKMGKRFAIVIGVAATGVMALGAQTAAPAHASSSTTRR